MSVASYYADKLAKEIAEFGLSIDDALLVPDKLKRLVEQQAKKINRETSFWYYGLDGKKYPTSSPSENPGQDDSQE